MRRAFLLSSVCGDVEEGEGTEKGKAGHYGTYYGTHSHVVGEMCSPSRVERVVEKAGVWRLNDRFGKYQRSALVFAAGRGNGMAFCLLDNVARLGLLSSVLRLAFLKRILWSRDTECLLYFGVLGPIDSGSRWDFSSFR